MLGMIGKLAHMIPRMRSKGSPAAAAIGALMRGQVNTARSYERLRKEAYCRNPIVRSCITEKANAMGSVAWEVIDSKGDTVEDHPILDLLAAPNPTQTAGQFWRDFMIAYDVGGGAPLHVNGAFSSAGENVEPIEPGAAQSRPQMVKELYVYAPSNVGIVPGPAGVPAEYRWDNSGRKIVFNVDQTNGNSRIRVYRHALGLDDEPYRYGIPPVETCAAHVDYYNVAMQYNVNLLDQDAVPKGYWHSEGEEWMTEEHMDQVIAHIHGQMSGPQGNKSPVVDKLRFFPTNLTPRDIDWLPGMQFCSREIARTLDVPPLLLGISGDNTYANYETALLAFYAGTILPLARDLARMFNSWLMPAWDPSLRLVVDEESIPALEPIRVQKWDKVGNSPVLTINEKREALGYPPIDDPEADTIMVPANTLPLGLDGADVQ